jgi:hypothetical protein
MHLDVIRNRDQSSHSTVGKMYLDKAFECFTLEPPVGGDVMGNNYVCIPEGNYPLKIFWSPEHARLLPHIQNVTGRSFIEIHIGNYPRDTKGCTLVGKTHPFPDFIGNSSMAFAVLISKLFAASTLTNHDAEEKNQIWNVGDISYVKES